MSTDYYLYSPSRRKSAMVGSSGFSGVMSWPGTPEVIEFIRWAIDESINDVVLINEHQLEDFEEAKTEGTHG